MSETMGRCRREITAAYESTRYKPSDSDMLVADAIDRLAADVAAVKAKVDAISPEDVRHFVESEKAWVAPPWQRAKWDEALAIICNGGDWGRGNNFDHGVLGALVIWADKEMDRLTAERDAAIRERDEARAEVERLRGELAARQPMAPPGVWLTGEERAQLRFTLDRMRRLGYSTVAEAIESILNRAGSPPVVEVPAMPLEVGDANTHTGQYLRGRRDIAVSYRDALDKAGVAWKEVGRE